MFPFYAVIKTIIGLKRICPECNKAQVVKPSQKRVSVPCRFCEAMIPASESEGDKNQEYPDGTE